MPERGLIIVAMVHAAAHRLFLNATAAGIAMAITLMGDLAAPVVSDKWLIDIRTAISVGGTVLIATWWLGRKFQNIEDRLSDAEMARGQMQKDLGELIKANRDRRH